MTDTKEKAPTTGTVNQGSGLSNKQIDLITKAVRGALQDLDTDITRLMVCASAMAAGHQLTGEDHTFLQHAAHRLHKLSRIKNG